MNEVLFFGGAALIVGLSYYLGFNSGINKNCKNEVRRFLMDMTVSKMLHEHFQRNAINETKLLLQMMGVKDPKNIKRQKLMTPEQFDSENKK
jgi:hypothetical protein